MVLRFQRISPDNRGLVLFFSCRLWILPCFIFILACSGQKEGSTNLDILWENDRATGLIVPSVYLRDVPEDSINNSLRVYISGSAGHTAILGEYKSTKDGIIFKPIIPFTSGLTYEVSVDGSAIGKIEIPLPDHTDLPEVTALYPSQDTLPENLLKVYLSFSHSMREGHALKYITLLKNGSDTLSGTFLDLQPELWNKDYTILTLWLDPGRIKRDLQPNKKLGVPLEHGSSYTLIVESGWVDTRSVAIEKEFSKTFFVGDRDSTRPDLKSWVLKMPKASTKDPLVIVFNESLDRMLSGEAIRITFANGDIIDGRMEIKDEETVLEFTPESAWSKGTYSIECEERLEDLAGNNLSRLFDRDLTKDAEDSNQEIFARKFTIQ